MGAVDDRVSTCTHGPERRPESKGRRSFLLLACSHLLPTKSGDSVQLLGICVIQERRDVLTLLAGCFWRHYCCCDVSASRVQYKYEFRKFKAKPSLWVALAKR